MRKVESHEYAPGQRANRGALAEITDLINDGAYEAASVTAWEVQRATPGDPAIWLLLTRIDFLRERYAGAMYAARMATRLDPSSADAWLWLARTAATRARWRTEGMDAALQATALAPQNPHTWTVLAQLHLVRDAYYEAAIAAERAVRVAPAHAEAHRMLGLIAAQADEWAHAAAAFRRALALEPNDVDARAGLIHALEAQGIDPSSELKRYGHPPRSPGDTGGGVGQIARDLSDPGPLRARPVVLLFGALACIVAGSALGVAVPTIGVTRGLVGAAALVLMWLAIWPLRLPRRARPITGRAPAVTTASAAISRRASAVTGPPAVEAVSAEEREEPAMASAKAEVVAGEPAGAPASGARTPLRRPAQESAPIAPERVEDPKPPLTGGEGPEGGLPAKIDDLPEDPADLVEISQVRLAEFDLTGARAAASRLAALAPDSLEAHRALAAVSLAEQDYAQAEWHYGKVLEIEPLDEEAHERLAMAKEGRRREKQPSQRQRQRRRRG